MSVNDDGTGLGPGTETRGGEDIDWARTEPGKPLREKEPAGEGEDAG